MTYLKVSVSDFLTLFSSRTKGFSWSSRPAWPLLAAAALSLGLSTLLACVWPTGTLSGTYDVCHASMADARVSTRGYQRLVYCVSS